MKPTRYRFRIEGFTPETMPMARLAEYMDALAKMLGEPERVHFVGLEKGSVAICQEVEGPAVERVRERLDSVNRREGPADALRAADRLNALLETDNTTGSLTTGKAEVVPFPGVNQKRPIIYNGIRQHGELEGVLVRIGGKDQTAHATLVDDEKTYRCQVDWTVARQMAPHLAGPYLRVFGTGRWNRTTAGKWELQAFSVRDFEVLEDIPLDDLFQKMRALPGNGWLELDDPHQVLADFRQDGEKPI